MKSLIKEVAITPEVFEPLCYETTREYRAAIKIIFDNLEATGLVTNIADGQWRSYIYSNLNKISPDGLKLIKFLYDRDRLVDRPKLSKKPISTDRDWFLEAILLSEKSCIDGVISTEDESASKKAHPLDLDDSKDWWIKPLNLQTSVNRNIEEYISILKPLLLYSNKITFYDKILNPSKPSYRNFGKILAICKDNKRKPLIELHRTIPHPNANEKDHFFNEEEWLNQFSSISKVAALYGLNIQLNIWHGRSLPLGTHPRFVISKLGSFSFEQGFDEGSGKNRVTFMNRAESDLWQGNFRSTTYKPVFSFKL
mgnify:CR=1 FL=1